MQLSAHMAPILALSLLGAGCVHALEVPDYSAYDFEAYLTEYGKSYATGERAQRRANFEENLRQISAQNALYTEGRASWVAGVNHFTDWAKEEFQKMLATVTRPSINHPTLTLSSGEGNPDSIDWRQKGAVTPVKAQGCGDCWAVSATETVESHYQIASGKLLELSPQTFVNCVKNPNDCGGTGGCKGATMDLAFNLTVSQGVADLKTLPYLGSDSECKPYRAAVKATGYVNIPRNDALALETALATKGPVAVAVAADWLMNYRGGVMDTCAYGLLRPLLGLTLNHGVQVVGYTRDYWIVRNSWGPGWGEGGYVRLSRKHDNTTWTDKHPDEGLACKPYPKTETVGGECGLLAYPSYPTGVTSAAADVVV